MQNKEMLDVIIVGGSYAGLSAAMSLGRACRNVLVIDSGQPCNIQTPHSHNFLTQDGNAPIDISTAGRRQVSKYDTIRFLDGIVTNAKQSSDGFEITTQAGDKFSARKLLFATGLKDILPAIPGFAACWGISILHCPYCHGYEVKNVKTALTANGDAGFEFARLIAHWTKDLTLLTNGRSTLSGKQTAQLTTRAIKIIETPITNVEHQEGMLRAIVLDDQSSIQAEALYARPALEQHCRIPEALGCELTDQGLWKVDAMQKTTVRGVFACGDNSSPARALAISVASGTMAGAAINKELVEESYD